ncbi:hypothetical protein [Vogesella indigofera]|uniref:hypothetical protein n=1 Tax=Vogesella indigofera TaxID=45465 RepID=UPI00234F7348|nr:hypothetical protein [Vogesella indigofera]MDC7710851.1 hypothetical protein [Vogesella indigofera]
MNFKSAFSSALGWLKKHPGFVAMVVAPTLVTGGYFGLVASDRYVSESQLTVKQSNNGAAAASIGIAALIGGVSTTREDVHYLRQHILSLDMLKALEANMGLRKAYGSTSVDWFSRLFEEASQEEFYKYYLDHVSASIDDTTGILTLRVEGFDPVYAQKLNRYITAQSEAFINTLSHQIANEEVSFVETQLADSRVRLKQAKDQLLVFQNKHGMLSPTEQAKATAGFLMEVKNAIAQQEAEYKSLVAYLNADAPQVVALRQKIDAMKAQLQTEQDKLSGNGDGKLNSLAASFMELEFNAEFAEHVMKSALTALEKTRVEAAQKLKHVTQITSPQVPEDAEYPRRLYLVFSVLVLTLLAYGIGRMTLETIKDHRD